MFLLIIVGISCLYLLHFVNLWPLLLSSPTPCSSLPTGFLFFHVIYRMLFVCLFIVFVWEACHSSSHLPCGTQAQTFGDKFLLAVEALCWGCFLVVVFLMLLLIPTLKVHMFFLHTVPVCELVCLSCFVVWGDPWSVSEERCEGGEHSQESSVSLLPAITQHNSSLSCNILLLLPGRWRKLDPGKMTAFGHPDRCPVTERLLPLPLSLFHMWSGRREKTLQCCL